MQAADPPNRPIRALVPSPHSAACADSGALAASCSALDRWLPAATRRNEPVVDRDAGPPRPGNQQAVVTTTVLSAEQHHPPPWM